MENKKAGKYENLFSSSLFDHLSGIFNKTEHIAPNSNILIFAPCGENL